MDFSLIAFPAFKKDKIAVPDDKIGKKTICAAECATIHLVASLQETKSSNFSAKGKAIGHDWPKKTDEFVVTHVWEGSKLKICEVNT